MKCDDWNRLDWAAQYRNEDYGVEIPKAQGFDTETRNGKAFIIAREDGRIVEPDSFTDCLAFLSQRSNRSANNFFYNLKYDVQAMLKHAPQHLWMAIENENGVEYNDYTIQYIPGKAFRIKKYKNVFAYYDLAQFMPGGLDYNAKQYLGKEKKDVDASRMDEPGFVEENYDRIKNYCIYDAFLCGELGRHLSRLHERLGVSFYKPISPANTSMKYVSHRTDLRKFYPKSWQKYAFEAYTGGRFELLQRGSFENVYRYDLNSAYPAIIAELPDLSKGYWKHSYEYLPDAELGYCKAEIEQRGDWATPIPFKPSNLVKFPRIESGDTFITKNEFETLENSSHCDVELIDGWFWFPTKLERPFRFLYDWYQRRQALKERGDDLEHLLKTMMNSIYGKFIQVTKTLKEQDEPTKDTIYWKTENGEAIPCKRGYRTGPYFSPVYASKLCADVRLEIFDKLVKQRSKAIAAHTDSVFTQKKFSDTGKEMGEWKFEGKGDLIIYATGVYSFNTPGRIKRRTRGFRLKDSDSLEKVLKESSDSTDVKLMVKHAVSILEVMRHKKKYDPEDMNVIEWTLRSANVNTDSKREWEEDFSSASEVLESVHSSRTLEL